MSIDEFIHTKQEQLHQFEQTLEKRAHDAGEKITTQLETFRAKRDDLVARLHGLKSETSERVDVLRMRIESAWDELHTAFETATSRDPNGKATGSPHASAKN